MDAAIPSTEPNPVFGSISLRDRFIRFFCFDGFGLGLRGGGILSAAKERVRHGGDEIRSSRSRPIRERSGARESLDRRELGERFPIPDETRTPDARVGKRSRSESHTRSHAASASSNARARLDRRGDSSLAGSRHLTFRPDRRASIERDHGADPFSRNESGRFTRHSAFAETDRRIRSEPGERAAKDDEA